MSAGLKTIRRRITTVQNTKQITRAMKLVSAAKLRRAQEAALQGREFIDHLSRMFATVIADLPEDFSHPLIGEAIDEGNRQLIAVAGERGLCGAFNANVYKALSVQEAEQGGETAVLAIGRKSVANAKLFGMNLMGRYEDLSENVDQWPLSEIGKQVTEDFLAGKYTEVAIYYTAFVSMVRQEVTRDVLLPISIDQLSVNESEPVIPGMTKYDPQPEQLLTELIPKFLMMKLRQAILESRASEHAARMRAMDSATRNADELTDKLRLFYNRARQSAITTELIDIVGGAEALT